MAKKALIVLAEGFEDIEGVTCVDILRRAGVEVTVAGLKEMQVKASRGTRVIADALFNEVQGGDYDALVLPGGMPGATNLAASNGVRALIQRMAKDGKVIAAICAAPSVVLAPAGILKGRSVTGFPGMTDTFDKSTIYKEEAVVVDGALITSRGPATALAFALAIVEKLVGSGERQKISRATLYS